MDNTNLEELIEKAMQKYLEDKYIFIATSRNEYLQAVHAIDYFLVLFNLEEQLRSEVKWNESLDPKIKEAYLQVRTWLYEIMNDYRISFNDLE